ncbi:MAG: hypothetical protein Q8P83_03625 [bacterium]|nr:hypothetical protein [bacterium]
MRRFVVALFVVCMPAQLFAQVKHGQEVELGSNGKGEPFYSHYFLFDQRNLNGFVRPFWVHDVLTRVEIGVGPTTQLGPIQIKWTLGGTSDGEAMIATLSSAKVRGRSVIYVADLKLALGQTNSTLYQKLWWALDQESVWQFRYEQLNVGNELAFVRPGIEYQIQLSRDETPVHFYIAPSYDPKLKQWGGQIGFRFFDLKIN